MKGTQPYSLGPYLRADLLPYGGEIVWGRKQLIPGGCGQALTQGQHQGERGRHPGRKV